MHAYWTVAAVLVVLVAISTAEVVFVKTCPTDTEDGKKWVDYCNREGMFPVCFNGTTYLNAACASCNSQFEYEQGNCTSAIIDTCPTGHPYTTDCQTSPTAILCDTVNRTEYKNKFCAFCNRVATLIEGHCPPLPPHVSTCSGSHECSSNFKAACAGNGWRPVCGQDVQYANRECAYCSDLLPKDVIDGLCDETDIIRSCPTGLHCSNRNTDFKPVCGWDDQTYFSADCARCNGVVTITQGRCPAPAQPCETIKCGKNATCTVSTTDCTFESGACGWTASNTSTGAPAWIVTNAKVQAQAGARYYPPTDYTYHTSQVGNYLLFNASDDTRTNFVFSDQLDTVKLGHSCVITFAYAIAGSQSFLNLSLIQNDPVKPAAAIWTGNATSALSLPDTVGVWKHHWQSLAHTTTNPAKLFARFTASTNGRGFVAIDQVDVFCGADDRGECACNEGYRMTADHTCVPSAGPDWSPVEPKLIDQCRAGASCALTQACDLGDKDPVCAAGTGYKNWACALCNYESRPSIYNGSCTAPPAPNDMIATCLPQSVRASACATSPVHVVCAANKQYKSPSCAQCNNITDYVSSFCSAAVSAATVEVVDTCPDKIVFPASNYVTLCQNVAPNVACATPGPRDATSFTQPTNFKNSYCALCNSITNFSRSFCESEKPEAEDGRLVISNCDGGDADAPSFLTYSRECQRAAPHTVCLHGQNYRNWYCAKCHVPTATPEEVVQAPCLALKFPIVETCNTTNNNHSCWFFSLDPVCGPDGRTYKSPHCAQCNGLRADSYMHGACENQVVLPDLCHKNNVGCDSNARCARMLGDCDFEEEPNGDGFCGWTNAQGTDDFNWTRHQGATGTYSTGPSVDKTTNTSKGWFAYIQASKQQVGHQAQLISPPFLPTYEGYACELSFWYHMYGKDVDSISLAIKTLQHSNIFETVWTHTAPATSADENHNQWRRAAFNLHRYANKGALQVRIAASVGGLQGDIAIDDVEILCSAEDGPGSECICNAGYQGDGFTCVLDPDEDAAINVTVAPPTIFVEIDTCPGTADEAAKEACEDLPQSSVCVDSQGYKNKYCALCNGASKDDIFSGPCFAPDFVADCPVDADETLRQECLFFSQHLVCDAKTGTTTFKNTFCAQCRGLAEEDLAAGACSTGSIQHPCDDVSCPANAECSLTVVDCDFEDEDVPFCGWTNVVSNDKYAYDHFDWTIGRNGTATQGTGPSVDHTLGTAEGHYAYIETSQGDYGWEAHLTSPIFKPSDLGSHCHLSFWYHMWGTHVNLLAVDIREANTGDFVNAWTIRGANDRAESNHDRWVNHAHVNLASYTDNIQIRLRGVRGSGVAGDIAIDDVQIICGTPDFGQCSCMDGYETSGSQCVGDLMTELRAHSENYSIALRFLEAAGLGDRLSSQHGLTLFLPMDSAFADIEPAKVATILESPPLVAAAVSHFMVLGIFPAGKLFNNMQLLSVANRTLTINVATNGQIYVNKAVLYEPDLMASNGVIHGLATLPSGALVMPPANQCGSQLCNVQTQYCVTSSSVLTRVACSTCALTMAPVCGYAGGKYVSYYNACFATCANAVVAYDGQCQISSCRSLPTCDMPYPNYQRFYCDQNARCVNSGTTNADCVCHLPYVGSGEPGTCTMPSATTATPCTGGRVQGCSGCVKTCTEPNPICTLDCKPGCTCPVDKPLWDEQQEECITQNDCKDPITTTQTPSCNADQILTKCANCQANCSQSAPKTCSCDGVVTCGCNEQAGYFYAEEYKQCVPREKCPQVDPCSPNPCPADHTCAATLACNRDGTCYKCHASTTPSTSTSISSTTPACLGGRQYVGRGHGACENVCGLYPSVSCSDESSGPAGCYCPLGSSYDPTSDACVRECPSSTTILSTTVSTATTTPACPINMVWSDFACNSTCGLDNSCLSVGSCQCIENYVEFEGACVWKAVCTVCEQANVCDAGQQCRPKADSCTPESCTKAICSDPACPGGQVWQEQACKDGCQKTCDHRDPQCQAEACAEPGCACVGKTPFWHNQKCVAETDCPRCDVACKPRQCADSEALVLVANATGIPPFCCDQYECSPLTMRALRFYFAQDFQLIGHVQKFVNSLYQYVLELLQSNGLGPFVHNIDVRVSAGSIVVDIDVFMLQVTAADTAIGLLNQTVVDGQLQLDFEDNLYAAILEVPPPPGTSSVVSTAGVLTTMPTMPTNMTSASSGTTGSASSGTVPISTAGASSVSTLPTSGFISSTASSSPGVTPATPTSFSTPSVTSPHLTSGTADSNNTVPTSLPATEKDEKKLSSTLLGIIAASAIVVIVAIVVTVVMVKRRSGRSLKSDLSFEFANPVYAAMQDPGAPGSAGQLSFDNPFYGQSGGQHGDEQQYLTPTFSALDAEDGEFSDSYSDMPGYLGVEA